MKSDIVKGCVLFIVIMLFSSSLIWNRYQGLSSQHLKMREAAFHSAYASINHTFRLVSKTIAQEVLLQPKMLKLVYEVTVSEGEQRNHARGLLYRALSPLYERVSQHSVQQFHFHFPDNCSMLRFHMPHRSGDDLSESRPSVVMANHRRCEVHGYESGRIVTGFRHVFPLEYHGLHIGSVEVSHSYQQLRHELGEHAPDSQFQFIMLKDELWSKLMVGQQELYSLSPLHSDYLCENRQSSFYHQYQESDTAERLERLLLQIGGREKVKLGIESKKDFEIVDTLDGELYSILFHSIANIDGKHTAFIISSHAEPQLNDLQYNAWGQFVVALLFSVALVVFRVKSVKHQNEKEGAALFLQTVTNHIGEGLYTTDKEGQITFFNPEASRLLGYENSEVVGANAHDLFHTYDSQHQQDGCVILNTIMNQVTYQQKQALFVHKDKGEFPVELTCTPLRKMGEICGCITIFHDITERCKQENVLNETQVALRKANLSLEKLSRIDGLTGVANRREFDRCIVKRWKVASRRLESLALLMIDIDHFKAYNDNYGHVQGDECLRRVAAIIEENCLRPEDFVARYGGEEFAILLTNTSPSDSIRVANRICNALASEKIMHTGSKGYGVVTLSAGVCSIYPTGEENVETLIIHADEQLYCAKQSGRNRVCFKELQN